MSMRRVFILESTGNIVRLLGFPEDQARAFTEMDPFRDFVLAKSFKLWAAASDVAVYPETFKTFFRRWKGEHGDELQRLLKTHSSLKKKIVDPGTTWQDVLEAMASVTPETELKVLIDFGDGWRWVELTDRDHGRESKLMQHCASDSRGALVSLRDPRGAPHVTMTYNAQKNAVYQIKGKQNVLPKDDYWPAIVSFFGSTKAILKDPLVKREKPELSGQITAVNGQDADPTKTELGERLFRALQTDAAREWLWSPEQLSMDVEEGWEEMDDSIIPIFQKAGYESSLIEPYSGEQAVWHHPSRFGSILRTSDPQTIDPAAVPPWSEVDGTVQGLFVYVLARDKKIGNPRIGKRLIEFAEAHAAELDAVISAVEGLIGSENSTTVAGYMSTGQDNYADPLEYEELVGEPSEAPEKRISSSKYGRSFVEFMNSWTAKNPYPLNGTEEEKSKWSADHEAAHKSFDRSWGR